MSSQSGDLLASWPLASEVKLSKYINGTFV